MPSPETTLRIALIGCGGIAQDHWRGISELAGTIEVTAAIDVDPVRARNMA